MVKAKTGKARRLFLFFKNKNNSAVYGQSKAAAIQNSTIVKGLLHEGLCSNPFFIR